MIIPVVRGALSLSGHPVAGSKKVRFIFVDESGNSSKEPVTVVAAVILHGDAQWRPVVDKLNDIKNRMVPSQIRDGFIFHAVDLFSGTALGKEQRQHSLDILEAVLRIPEECGLSISFGFCRKLDAAMLNGIDPEVLKNSGNRVIIQHVMAFMASMSKTDNFIASYCPGEVGTVIAEDNQPMRKALKLVPSLINKGSYAALYPPMRSIVGTVNYAAKDEEPILQLADACAWTVRRAMSGFGGAERFVAALCAEEGLGAIKNDGGLIGGWTIARYPSDIASQPVTPMASSEAS